jgi:hypothetical protein
MRHDADDLFRVDALQVDACDPQVRVTKLALNDVQRDTFSSHFDGMCMAELMWCEPTSDTGALRHSAQVLPSASTAPETAAAGLADQAQQWAHGEFAAEFQPSAELGPCPVVHANLAALAALSISHKQ